jgi:hypothetical protein
MTESQSAELRLGKGVCLMIKRRLIQKKKKKKTSEERAKRWESWREDVFSGKGDDMLLHLFPFLFAFHL